MGRDCIASLCERLDRLPLAIELAAARIGAMSPAEILAGLEPRLGALGGGRLSPSRHRTVRATVEWSHQPGRCRWDRDPMGNTWVGEPLPASAAIEQLAERIALGRRGTDRPVR